MQSSATTVEQYLASLPEDRQKALLAVREVILKNLPAGYEEGMQYGMIGYFVPHSVYPAGYHCDPTQPLPYAALASQKNYMSVYLNCMYANTPQEVWFREAWAKTGKKLDMGKCCVRFKKIDDLPLNVIGQAIKRVPAKQYIALYEAARSSSQSRGQSAPKPKTTIKKTAKSTAKSRAKTPSRADRKSSV